MGRLVWIDNLRGFLILLVVLGHSIQYGVSDWEHNHVFNYIYSFHMPLFMCISGYVSVNMKLCWFSFSKRFFQLIVPFISMSIVYSIYEGRNLVLEWILNPGQGLWFLWCLFFIICIHVLVLWMSSHSSWIKEEALALGVALVLIASMRSFAMFAYPTICKFYLYFMVGFYMHKYYNRIRPYLMVLMWPLLFSYFVIAYSFQLTSIPTCLQVYDNVIVRQLYSIVVSCVAICCFIPFFEKYFAERVSGLTSVGGGKTLGLYAFHQLIMRFWPCSYLISRADDNYFDILSIWLLSFTISYFLVMILERNSLTAFLFLGKNKW